MTRNRRKVAIVGGGMAGLSTAWRLSEPGWQDRFESITIYQRGWRLGGKGASSRGVHGRIEEHGLHIWLGSYENAFALLRECYHELDRATTDPGAPIRDWRQAMIPADDLGLADQFGSDWLTWLGTFARNDSLPGDPGGTGREMTVVGFAQRALQLVLDFLDSINDPPALALSAGPDIPAPGRSAQAATLQRTIVAAMLALTSPDTARRSGDELLRDGLDAIRAQLDDEHRPDHRRAWLLVSMVTAVVRGIVADNLVTDPRGFHAIDDEDFGQWILRHGAHADVLDYPLIRGVYDLVFGYEDADPARPAVAAGLMIFLIGLVLFEYKGAIFWKMTAGMGDVIIAPIYQVLRRRGVRFEFFHRLDALHLDPERRTVDAMTMARQIPLAADVAEYDPLVRVRGLPVFPDAPRTDQVAGPEPADGWHALETYFATPEDAATRVLRSGEDFDVVVLAVSLGMVDVVARELLEDSPGWREMCASVRTVATQAFQLWLRPREEALGWSRPGVTVSAYTRPFETWASMPQTLWAEDWPQHDAPATVAYFCGSLDAPWPIEAQHPGADYLAHHRGKVVDAAVAHIEDNLGLFFPKAFTDKGFDWRLLAGTQDQTGAAALCTQYVSVNVDPSDRYVQSVPGSDRYRLRPDESGYDNLVLAGDWTDSGMNAGCIEAAVMSGLEAANAVLGRGRFHRIRGYWLP
ncbi:MAG TPA: FAD-dependent oxidoreductase [Mycobacterium sp.]|nr:FAD-dependent oxidoreductase [Mycobacterium sp.]